MTIPESWYDDEDGYCDAESCPEKATMIRVYPEAVKYECNACNRVYFEEK